MADHGEFHSGDEQQRNVVADKFDGDPQPLRAGYLPPFPLAALPGPYALMAGAVAEALQVDTAMSCTMVLGALSAACGGCVEAEVQHDWREVGVLHLVIAVGPSERKSAAQSPIIAPLRAAETAMIEAVRPRRDEALARKRIAEQKAKNAERNASAINKDKARRGDDAGGEDRVATAVRLAAVAATIDVPELRRLLADDATPEALNSRLAANRGRLAVVSAEGGMFDTLTGRYSKGGANLDGWNKGYTGDPIIVDRVGREGESIDRPALTVCLAVQPSVLDKVCADERFAGTGLLSRLSIAQPRSMIGSRDPDAAVPLPEHVTAAYAAALSDLARRLHERDGAPVAVKFSPAARAEIAEIQRRVERRLVNGGDLSGDLESWGGKHVGRVVRIALLCHMAEHGATGVDLPISPETVVAARHIGEFFAAHTRAAFGIADTCGVKVSDLAAAGDYLRRCEAAMPLAAIPVRNIGKSGPSVLRRKSIREPILDALADFNIITRGKDLGREVVWLHPLATLPHGATLW
ncbi:hypothetical protein ABIA30_004272 [Mycobacterium sp. MAA66]|uniref:YfjI family protein n=1 Tax=Mycobacterium sp. MAA66 TaxID=3156297 RepID=UPI0035172B21